MSAPFPSPTATWHDDTYAAINPKLPELSMKGKTVVVTGGGRGIGKEIVRSFAVAGAKHVAIIGRSETSLKEAKKAIGEEFPSTTITAHAGDMVDLKSMKQAAAAIGTWDVLVLNAGYMPNHGSIATADIDDWWLPFEINVKGNMVVSQAFLPTKGTNATVIGSSTAAVSFPIPMVATLERASYTASKLATVRLMELLGAENPDLRVITIHPGAIETDMLEKLRVPGVPVDKSKFQVN